MTLSTPWAVRWIDTAAADIETNRSHLIDLDREIGDGDHGENMARGFAAVTDALSQADPHTPADVLTLVARTLISTVGGASGPLFGTAFLKAAQAITGKEELSGADVIAMLDGARGGVEGRGRAVAEDKTMLDAWLAAVDEAKSAQSDDPVIVLEAAAHGAEQGAEKTEPLVARKGRASYLGDRSAGHRDPGAESTAIIVRAAAKAAKDAA